MSGHQNRFSIWLIPTNADSNYLRYYITSMADETRTSSFEPHCTLLGGISDCPAKDILIEIVRTFPLPISVQATSIDCSNDIWKSVYIQLAAAGRIMELQAGIQQELFPQNPYLFNPHISLVYTTEQINEKEQRAKRVGVKTTFVFDRIVVMKTGAEVHCWEKIFEIGAKK